jgi:hypothetical protein
MPSAENRSPMRESDPSELRAAFRELHGARLHGFTLLVALGDRAVAARLAADAIATGSAGITELRHPERAAAWLRARVMRDAPGRLRWARPQTRRERHLALAELGADEAAIAGFEALDVRARAAVVARSVEGLDRRDVGTIVGADGIRLHRLLKRATARYVGAMAAVRGDIPIEDGPITSRVRSVTARALG